MADLIAWARGRLLLLVYGDLSGKEMRHLRGLSVKLQLGCVQVVQLGARETATATEHVRDASGRLQQAVSGARWALLRPDSYIVATGQQLDAELERSARLATGNG